MKIKLLFTLSLLILPQNPLFSSDEDGDKYDKAEHLSKIIKIIESTEGCGLDALEKQLSELMAPKTLADTLDSADMSFAAKSMKDDLYSVSRRLKCWSERSKGNYALEREYRLNFGPLSEFGRIVRYMGKCGCFGRVYPDRHDEHPSQTMAIGREYEKKVAALIRSTVNEMLEKSESQSGEGFDGLAETLVNLANETKKVTKFFSDFLITNCFLANIMESCSTEKLEKKETIQRESFC